MGRHFAVDTRQLKQLTRDLAILNRRGLPYATKQTVNSLAFRARREWQQRIGEAFTLRNKFTQGSIRVQQARGLDISRQFSVVGSVSDYLGTQERGGTVGASQGAKGKAVPHDSARVGGSHARLVRAPNKAARIRLHARRSGSQRDQNAARIRKARTSGSGFALIEKGSKRGIFFVGRGSGKSTFRLVHSLTKKRVRIRPRPTMKPAVERALQFVGKEYTKAIVFQLRRLRSYR